VGSRSERQKLGELLRWFHTSSVLRGRSFRLFAMRLRSPPVSSDRSVPLGMYWRNSPLVFSFEPAATAMGVAEVDRDAGVDREVGVAVHLCAYVPG
jgi:hypothetical protein